MAATLECTPDGEERRRRGVSGTQEVGVLPQDKQQPEHLHPLRFHALLSVHVSAVQQKKGQGRCDKLTSSDLEECTLHGHG